MVWLNGLENGLVKWSGKMVWLNGLDKWSGKMVWTNGLEKWSGKMVWLNGLENGPLFQEMVHFPGKWSGKWTISQSIYS